MKVANHNDVISTNSAAAFDSASSKSSKSPRVKSPKSSKSGEDGGGGGGGGTGACSPDPLNLNCLYDLVGPGAGACQDSAGNSFNHLTFDTASECECAQVCNECVKGKVIGGSFWGSSPLQITAMAMAMAMA